MQRILDPLNIWVISQPTHEFVNQFLLIFLAEYIIIRIAVASELICVQLKWVTPLDAKSDYH